MLKSNSTLMWKTKRDLTTWLLSLFTGTGILFLGRMSMAICEVEIKEEFNWNDEQLGRVMSVFFWGYATTQVLGGSAADLFGGDNTIVLSSLLWGSICFLTPFFTYLSFAGFGPEAAFYTIIILRILMGMTQGIHFPSLSSLLARRVNETNRSFSMSFVSCGGQFGTLICGFVGSILLDWTSWKFVFNIFGCMGMGFSYFLYNLKRKQQQTAHRVVSLDALEDSPLIKLTSSPGISLLNSSNANSISRKVVESTKTAISKVRFIFFKKHFVSLVAAHMASTNYTFILSFWLPKFFYDKYSFTNIQPWHYNVIPWLGVIPGAVISGVLSDALVKRTNLSLTSVRKIIEIIALIGSAVFLHPLTKIDQMVDVNSLPVSSSISSVPMAYDILSYTQNYFSPAAVVKDGKKVRRSVDVLDEKIEKLGAKFGGKGQGQGQGQGQNIKQQKIVQTNNQNQKINVNTNNKISNNKNVSKNLVKPDASIKVQNQSQNQKSKNQNNKGPSSNQKPQLNSPTPSNLKPPIPVESALFYITTSICLSNFHAAAAMVNPQDLAPQNAGSVFGVMNMMGAVSSSFGIWFTGYLLNRFERQWGLVFQWIIMYNIFGGVLYFMFGTGKRLV